MTVPSTMVDRLSNALAHAQKGSQHAFFLRDPSIATPENYFVFQGYQSSIDDGSWRTDPGTLDDPYYLFIITSLVSVDKLAKLQQAQGQFKAVYILIDQEEPENVERIFQEAKKIAKVSETVHVFFRGTLNFWRRHPSTENLVLHQLTNFTVRSTALAILGLLGEKKQEELNVLGPSTKLAEFVVRQNAHAEVERGEVAATPPPPRTPSHSLRNVFIFIAILGLLSAVFAYNRFSRK